MSSKMFNREIFIKAGKRILDGHNIFEIDELAGSDPGKRKN
jgi:hypothetical protein